MRVWFKGSEEKGEIQQRWRTGSKAQVDRRNKLCALCLSGGTACYIFWDELEEKSSKILSTRDKETTTMRVTPV